MTTAPTSFSVASFNLHAGVDGWGRPFDVVTACRNLDADLLVLQETWTPAGVGAAEGRPPEPGLAQQVGAALGYTVVEQALANGRLAGPHPRADHRWMRPMDWRGNGHAIYLDDHRPLGPRVTGSSRFTEAQPGAWGLAVLSRLPVVGHRVIELDPLPRDRSGRAAVVVHVRLGDRLLAFAGTHMSHLTYGSPIHYRRLRRLLATEVGDGPAVLAGDMNLWGPPVGALFGGWHRVVRGRTWPAWRPHSQVDHILVRGPVAALEGRALPAAGSDHRPVRARLALRPPS